MDISRLYAYHVWANGTLLQHLRTLPEDVLHTETKSSFSTIAITLRHMWGCDSIWLLRMMSEPDLRNRVFIYWPESEIPLATIDTVEEKYRFMQERYEVFLAEDRDLDALVELELPDDPPMSSRDMLYHVINHATYHRGNIATMLRQLGYSSTNTDYEMYAAFYRER